ncbi:MAG: hypothetical protein O3C34_08700 [Proteobacteria bacterium]|nr:hypothetical protein [Pseudomonadota bacterium]
MANLLPFAILNQKITDSGIPKLSLNQRRLVLTADFTAGQDRRKTISAKAERIASMLQTESRPDPKDLDDQDDVAHHYAATLRPTLADLNPAQKAAAIRGYVEETGIAPDAALKSLLGLTATGDPATRIAAASALTKIFAIDTTARDRVPPALAAHAELMVQLADKYEITPEKAVRTAEALFGVGATGANQPSPALIQLAGAKNNAGEQTDEEFDFALRQESENGIGDDDVEFDEDDTEALALIEEFGIFRDTLVDDENNASTEFVGSVDALMAAMDRRDPDETARLIGQLEEQFTEQRARQADNPKPVQLASLDGIGGPQANPQLLRLFDLLNKAKKFWRNLRRGPGGSARRRPNVEEPNKDGVIIPKPPSPPNKSGPASEKKRGIGDNLPPSSQEDENVGPNAVQEVELSPGITVRGNPSSSRWANFKNALGRLSGKSRDAAESLVNGGELTTIPGTHGSITNITRKGGLKESTEAYDQAVTKAGGDPTKVPAARIRDVMIREYRNPDDGTEFVHRQPIGAGDLAVEIQISRRTTSGAPRPGTDQRIKIRFE